MFDWVLNKALKYHASTNHIRKTIKRTMKYLHNHFKNINLSKKIFRYYELKVPSYKLYNNKYIIASIQTTNTEIFEFISVLVLNLLSRNGLFTHRKRQQKLLKSRLLFKKIANFTDQLLQNY